MRIRRRAEVNRGVPVLETIINHYRPCALKPMAENYKMKDGLEPGLFNQHFHFLCDQLHSELYDVRGLLGTYEGFWGNAHGGFDVF